MRFALGHFLVQYRIVDRFFDFDQFVVEEGERLSGVCLMEIAGGLFGDGGTARAAGEPMEPGVAVAFLHEDEGGTQRVVLDGCPLGKGTVCNLGPVLCRNRFRECCRLKVPAAS